MHSRTHAWLTALATGALCAIGPPAAAQKPPPAVAYTGPADQGAAVQVRKRIAAFAQRRGLGLYDLASKDDAPASRAAALEAAVADYAAFRYTEAIVKLNALAARARTTGGAGLTRRQLADLFIYRAMSKTEVTGAADARDDLVRAATLFPTFRLDEARFRPSLRAAFERARAAVNGAAAAELTLELPTGCAVHLDGDLIATATKLPLRPGLHYLRAVCADYLPLTTTVTLHSGARRLAPKLVPAPTQRAVAIGANKTAASLLWVSGSRTVPGRYTVELIDMSSRKTTRAWSVTIANTTEASRIDGILDSLVDSEFAGKPPPPVVIVKAPPTRWYQRKWVWVAVGAVAATAIIVPLTLDSSDSTGFGATVTGSP